MSAHLVRRWAHTRARYAFSNCTVLQYLYISVFELIKRLYNGDSPKHIYGQAHPSRPELRQFPTEVLYSLENRTL